MSDMLVFAIAAKDENTAISIFKRMSIKDDLFFDDKARDFWITLLKEYKCHRCLDFLRNFVPEEVKNAQPYPITTPNLTLESEIDVYTKKWNEILIASKREAPQAVFVTKFTEYGDLLSNGKDVLPIHYFRAALGKFITSDFSSAILMLETCVTLMRSNQIKPISDILLVDEVLTELTFRLFEPLKVSLSAIYQTYFKNNLYCLKNPLSDCHDVFLFPLSETITLDTLLAATLSMEKFNNFKRTLPFMKTKQDPNFQHLANRRLFTIRLMFDWVTKIEKQHGLAVLFESVDDLKNKISQMKDERLVKVLRFHYVKMHMLHAFVNVCSLLGQVNNPYKALLEQTIAVYSAAHDRNNAVFLALMIEPEINAVQLKNTNKTKKQNKNQVKNKQKQKRDDIQEVTEKPLDEYKELPTYYPEPPKSPMVVKPLVIAEKTQLHLLMFGTKLKATTPVSSQVKKQFVEPKAHAMSYYLEPSKQADDRARPIIANKAQLQLSKFGKKLSALPVTFSEVKKMSTEPKAHAESPKEMPLAKNRIYPNEIYALFRAFNAQELFLTGLSVCELLHGRQNGRYSFVTLLDSNEMLIILKRYVAHAPEAKININTNSVIHVHYGKFHLSFEAIKPVRGSVELSLRRHANKQFFTMLGVYIWIEDGREKMLDVLAGALHLRNHVLELSDIRLSVADFIAQPDKFLEAIYFTYKYQLQATPLAGAILYGVLPYAPNVLSKVDGKILQSFCDAMIRDFARTFTEQVFYQYNILEVMRCYLINNNQAEKNVATPGFRS